MENCAWLLFISGGEVFVKPSKGWVRRNQRNANWQGKENELSFQGKNDAEGSDYVTTQYFGCVVCCYDEFLAHAFKNI